MRGTSFVPVFRIVSISSCLFFASGCAMFRNYNDSLVPVQQCFCAGQLEEAMAQVARLAKRKGDAVCYQAELGILAQVARRYEESNRAFSTAEDLVTTFDNKALISLTDTTIGLTTLLTNDKVMPYRGEGFEKVLFNTHKALNYLMLGQAEAARVEVRRAENQQGQIVRQHEKELAAWRARARMTAEAEQTALNAVQSEYQKQETSVQTLPNAYENAFTYFLSSLVYELNGEPNSAYVYAKRAYLLRPQSAVVRRELLRYSRASGIFDDYTQWQRAFPELVRTLDPPDSIEMVLILQRGFAPRKEEIFIPIPTQNGLVAAAFPRYVPTASAVSGADVYVSGVLLGHTELMADLQAMAIRNLWDRLPVLVIRQALRSATKAVIAKQITDEAGTAGMVLVSLYNLASEQADLRGWLMLPQDVQVLRVPVPRGTRQVDVVLRGSGSGAMGTHRIQLSGKARRLVLVNMRATDCVTAYDVVEY